MQAMQESDHIQLTFEFEAIQPAHKAAKGVVASEPVAITPLAPEPITQEPVALYQAATNIPTKRGRPSTQPAYDNIANLPIPSDDMLYTKQYYTMHQVTTMFKVSHSLIRFWENEFDILQPRKNKKGDRLFRPQDVKNITTIYYLLKQKKYTIAGAKAYMQQQSKANNNFSIIQELEHLKSFLQYLKAQL